MNLLALVPLAIQLGSPTPMPSDTPPAFPAAVSRLAELRSAQDVVGVTLLANGKAAPDKLALPTLINQRHTLDYMRVHYPESMKKVGSRGTAIAWVLVHANGRTGGARLLTTSGHPALDSLSLAVLKIAEFKPAMEGERAVAVWTPVPARIPTHEELMHALTTMERDISEVPVETPFTQKPVLLNRSQVQAAILRVLHGANKGLIEQNEAFNRAQRVGGRADMWIFIRADGSIGNVLLKKTTGNSELDASAHTIAGLMRFAPAKNGDVPVDVWIEVPINFSAER